MWRFGAWGLGPTHDALSLKEPRPHLWSYTCTPGCLGYFSVYTQSLAVHTASLLGSGQLYSMAVGLKGNTRDASNIWFLEVHSCVWLMKIELIASLGLMDISECKLFLNKKLGNKLSVVVFTYGPSTWRVEVGGWGARGQSQIHDLFEASLCYMRLCIKKGRKKKERKKKIKLNNECIQLLQRTRVLFLAPMFDWIQTPVILGNSNAFFWPQRHLHSLAHIHTNKF